MRFYTVHRPPVPSQDRLDQASELIFMKEGFSWLGFLFPLVWLLYNKLWVEFVLFLIFALILQGVLVNLGFHEQIVACCMLFVNLIFGFEANNIRRWKLARADYQLEGVVSGHSLQECELKFFSSWSPNNINEMGSAGFIPAR